MALQNLDPVYLSQFTFVSILLLFPYHRPQTNQTEQTHRLLQAISHFELFPAYAVFPHSAWRAHLKRPFSTEITIPTLGSHLDEKGIKLSLLWKGCRAKALEPECPGKVPASPFSRCLTMGSYRTSSHIKFLICEMRVMRPHAQALLYLVKSHM